jgi:hypothetical protein
MICGLKIQENQFQNIDALIKMIELYFPKYFKYMEYAFFYAALSNNDSVENVLNVKEKRFIFKKNQTNKIAYGFSMPSSGVFGSVFRYSSKRRINLFFPYKNSYLLENFV